ncbi:NMT1-domain-containing protein [Ceraceosorus guamensis]|uniref:4-amino-5-hydroxymethyl-2-methylpyrimidine phosphate synthase n=1 Tax=Ceraceosorus guamensis TaxID=1522189 RepID=A0A316VWK2_9BASI|nr:NMT1-domain-containing protein [Ceraceosorus guamensis]PWN40691.1 NMT1-domain-containing protein [Ceraceosorus guamensis]
MGLKTDKVSFLLNWKATPYHIAVFLAQKQGLFQKEGIEVAILEPNDPSDVTDMIGSGNVDLGAKAMIHSIAAKAKGYDVTAIGSLMQEPFTGVIYLKGSGIDGTFQSLKGKRVGYVGHFGKIQLDELTGHFGMSPDDYTAVRTGMHMVDAIKRGEIDAGIGIESVNQVELEEWLKEQGRDPTDVQMMRIDTLAELGCCCFCSILILANDEFLARAPEKARAFLRAVKGASDQLFANPQKAWEEYKRFKPEMNTALNERIFERCFVYMSTDAANVPRDWTKVTNYSKRLGIVPQDFKPNYTNDFLSWTPDDPQDERAEEKQLEIAQIQKDLAAAS